MTRIALVQQGDPADPTSWSGVPASLGRGFELAGCELIPVSSEPRGADRIAQQLGMSWADQAGSRAFAAACSAAASNGLRRAAPLDGILMIGSGYRLRTDVPFATFDDVTVAQALRRPDPPYTSLSDAGGRRWLNRQRRIYKEARGCCMASSWAAASVREEYGVPADRVHVVGMGHNIDVQPGERDWSSPRFLFVGVDWERKRGAAVVSAFEAVRERHPDATLDLVGKHPPVEVKGVRGHGILALNSEEGQAEYRELLRSATCFLMPSAYEPLGAAYIDAGAAGVPCIGTTVGGARDAIGKGGRVVDPDDDGALVDAMLELARPETAERLGGLALEHTDRLTWRAVAERMLRVLRPSGIDIDSLADFLDSGLGATKAA